MSFLYPGVLQQRQVGRQKGRRESWVAEHAVSVPVPAWAAALGTLDGAGEDALAVLTSSPGPEPCQPGGAGAGMCGTNCLKGLEG